MSDARAQQGQFGPDSSSRRDRRDRDEEGRARNARPRDGLGRPLPYEAVGVERQPEGVARSPQEALVEAQELLDQGRPFHAHEVLEDAWKATSDTDERTMWRGLAQLAVGVTHAARGNTNGGQSLLRRAAENIRPFTSHPPHGINIGGLVSAATELADGLPQRAEPPAAETLARWLRLRQDRDHADGRSS